MTLELLPLTASGVEVPDRTSGQLFATALLVVACLVGLAVLYRRNRFANLPRAQARHKAALLGALRDRKPATVRIPATADVTDYREDVQAAIQRARDRAAGQRVRDDHTTLREATASVLAALSRGLAGSRLRGLFPDRLTTALAVLAVTIAAFGAPAVSSSRVAETLTRGETVGLWEFVSLVGDATLAVGGLALETVTAFPYAGTVAGILLAAALLTGQALFRYWYVSATVAAAGWLFLYWLGQRVGPERHGRLYGRREVSWVVVKPLAAVWVAGAVPATLGSLTGFGEAGAVVGLLFAAVVGFYVGAVAVIDVAGRVLAAADGPVRVLERHTPAFLVWLRAALERRRGADDEPGPVLEPLAYDPTVAADELAARLDETDHPWPGTTDWPLAAYLVCRRAFAVAAVVLAPLPVAYLVTGVTDGGYATVAGALFSGTPVGIAVLVAMLAGLGWLAWLARDAAGDVRDALTEAAARQSLRMAIFQRGLTIGAVVLSGGLLWAFSQSYWVPVVGGLVIGLAVWHGYSLVDRAAYRLDLFGREDARTSVLVQAYALPDADGDEHLVVQIGSDHRTSRDSVAALVDDALEIAAGVQRRERSVPATPGQQRASDLLELGLVDADVDRELDERIRKRLVDELRPLGRECSRSDLEDSLGDYPDDRWRAALERYRMLGVVSVQGDRVRLERDPWAADETASPADRWLGRSGV